jgi:hypothetical protein
MIPQALLAEYAFLASPKQESPSFTRLIDLPRVLEIRECPLWTSLVGSVEKFPFRSIAGSLAA